MECGDDGCGGSCGECGEDTTCVDGQCDGNKCGDDGCSGECGVCPDGEVCNLGTGLCVPDCGVASCNGRECGPDGCGGSCGTCPCEACDPDENVCNTQTFKCEAEQPKDCKWIFDCFDTRPEGDPACFQNCVDDADPDAQTDYQSLVDCVKQPGYHL